MRLLAACPGSCPMGYSSPGGCQEEDLLSGCLAKGKAPVPALPDLFRALSVLSPFLPL